MRQRREHSNDKRNNNSAIFSGYGVFTGRNFDSDMPPLKSFLVQKMYRRWLQLHGAFA